MRELPPWADGLDEDLEDVPPWVTEGPSEGVADPGGERTAKVQDASDDPLDIIGDSLATGWPVLTNDCLPAPLFRYVAAEADRLATDPCPIAGHVIAAISTVASDGWRIKTKSNDPWTQQPRIWTCVVKDVGARGTEMIRSAYWPLKAIDKDNHRQHLAELAAWQERQDALPAKQRGKSDDPKPREKRLLTNDGTVEALSETLRYAGEAGKLGIVCDELVTFLGGFGRYSAKGGSGRAQMLEAYDGGPQRVDRVQRGAVFVPNWSVTIAGNIQPRRLASMAKDLHDDGLFQRFMTIHAAPKSLEEEDDDRPINPALGDNYRAIIMGLVKLEPPKGADGKTVPCYLAPDGVAVRRSLMRLVKRLENDPSLPTIVRETASKWSGLFARLALVFHLVTLAELAAQGEHIPDPDKAQVPTEAAVAAGQFIRRIVLPNLFRLGFQTMPEDGEPAGHARWIAEHILAHRLQHITAREIGRARRQLRGQHIPIAEAMAVLEHAGWAQMAEGGRSDGIRWDINQKVHERFAEAAAAEAERRKAVIRLIRQKVQDL